MAIDTVTEAPQLPAARKRDFGSSARLWGGFFGRAWLWFLAACLIVTFLPMLFGWRPYVVESGSMQPRIKVGDVIMSSPEHDAKKLLGHVTIFNDPSRPGSVKSHRVISINKDGTLQTKGDANPSPDSVPVPMSDVKGLGRLLVRWIGLPLIWVQNGQWVKLALLVGSLWLAAFLVVRDRDEPIADEDGDETDDETDGDSDDGDAGPDGDADPDSDDVDELNIHRRDVSGRHLGENDPNAPLQWHPRGSTLRRFRKARHREPSALAEFCRSLAGRSGIVVVTVAGLLVPTAQAARAAFSATTANTGSTWATASAFGPSYTSDTNNLHPYLYWKLDDAKGATATTAADSSGNNRTGNYSPNASWTMQQVGGLTGQTPNYSALAAGGASDNTSCVYTANGVAAESPAPNTYSEIIWFKTAAGYTGGGKLIGFESTQNGVSNNGQGGQYDRMIYMDGAGKLYFAVWINAVKTVTSSTSYNDGNWHMAVATMGTDGMKLYVDNVMVGSDANNQSQDYTSTNGGWWRVGCGNLQGWGSAWTGANNPDSAQTNYGFKGNLDEATVYTTELSAQNIAGLYYDINKPSAPAIANPSFENGGNNSLTSWTCASGTCARTNAQHELDTHSASLAAAKRGTAEITQALTFSPFTSYTLTVYLHSGTANTTVTVGVSGGATASTTATPTTATNGWTQVSVPFTVGANGNVTIYILNNGSTSGTSTVYADNVQLN